jgi:hypothetical protein
MESTAPPEALRAQIEELQQKLAQAEEHQPEDTAGDGDTMTIELDPCRPGYVCAVEANGYRVLRYARGEIYEVSLAVGKQLLQERLLGRAVFRAAIVPTVDPHEETKERLEKLFNQIAAQGPRYLAKLAAAMGVAALEDDDDTEPADEPAKEAAEKKPLGKQPTEIRDRRKAPKAKKRGPSKVAKAKKKPKAKKKKK